MLKFDTTLEEMELVQKISKRAFAMYKEAGSKASLLEISMDITACHANGCPLNLWKLLRFPEYDFLHDITGIARHIDRNTGRLKDCFVPRSAR